MGKLAPLITVRLHGPFAVFDDKSKVLTPKSAKGQALFALLVTAEDFSRSRAWLQGKLWSARGREQGAASLRQALTELRKCLGPHADVLSADRRLVQLDPNLVEVQDPGDSAGEFLEGLDVKDSAFDEWCADQRRRMSGATAPAFSSLRPVYPGAGVVLPLRVLIRLTHVETDFGRQVARLFSDTVSRSVAERCQIETRMLRPGEEVSPADLIFDVDTALENGNLFVRAAIERGPDAAQLWAGHRSVPMRGAPPIDHVDMCQLTAEALDALMLALAREAQAASDTPVPLAMAHEATSKIFSFDPEAQAEADALLAAAYKLDGAAVHLAWRVFLKMTSVVELNRSDVEDVTREVEALSEEALAKDSMNSMVLAAAAHSNLKVRENVAGGYDLARRAVHINPHNPLALDAMMEANLYVGKFEEAHKLATRTAYLMLNSPFKHWWDMGCCLTSVVTGRYEMARKFAQTAHALAPQFRPPLRYMTALFAHQGEPEKARLAMERLQVLEPEFSLDRMISDDTYPVATLRRSAIITDEIRGVLS